MKNFRTYNLAIAFYRNCMNLKLDFVIKNQFERAVLSILCNLAEGWGKSTRRDRRKYFQIAFGSLRESQCMLELIGNKELITQADVLAAHLYKLCKNT